MMWTSSMMVAVTVALGASLCLSHLTAHTQVSLGVEKQLKVRRAPAVRTDKYLLDASGAGVEPMMGYKLATLEDLKDEAFAAFYSKRHLPTSGRSPAGRCTLVQVAGGFLSVAAGTEGHFVSVSAGVHAAKLSVLHKHGVVAMNELNATVASQLGSRTDALPADCEGQAVVSWGIYTFDASLQRPYVVYGAGQGYSAPPGYTMVSLADVKSAKFVNYYNAHGLHDLGEQPDDVCCIFATTDGFLSIWPRAGAVEDAPGHVPHDVMAYFTAFTAQEQPQCASPLENPVWFGIDPQGFAINNEYIGRLNETFIDILNVTHHENLDPGSTCQGVPTWWGIYKLK